MFILTRIMSMLVSAYQTWLKKGEQMKMDDDKNMAITYGDNLWRYATQDGAQPRRSIHSRR